MLDQSVIYHLRIKGGEGRGLFFPLKRRGLIREGVLHGGYMWRCNFRFLPGPFTTWYNFSLMQRLRYDAGYRFPL